MKIFHQAGHNTNWNLESFIDDKAGYGIIFSPVHYAKSQLDNVNTDIKTVSMFDPQFYVPDSQKNKLNSYPFFPEKLTGGFSTLDYEARAYESAELCYKYQIENGFESCIIPARYFPEMITDYKERQTKFTVEPFLSAYEKFGGDQKLILTLPITHAMLLDKKYRLNLLNWVTSFAEIDGVYLLVNFDEPTKQICTYEKLMSYMSFIDELQGAELFVICGYCNTEGILLPAMDVYGVTMGAYENTRRFSIDKFLDTDQKVRGPAPRLFFPKLLNWIRWETAEEIKEDVPGIWEAVYTPTDHSESVFKTGQRPHFTKPQLYKHHFELMNQLFEELRELSLEERRELLIEKVINAHELYIEIERNRILFFDENCSGQHLPVWNRVLKNLPI